MKTSEQVAQYVFAARDEYIEKQKIRRAKMMKAVPFGAAAVIALAAVGAFAVFRSGINSDGRGAASGGYSGNVMNTTAATTKAETVGYIAPYIMEGAIYVDPDTGMERGWDEKPPYYKFLEFTHDGCNYRCQVTVSGGMIEPANIGEKLYDVTMSTVETFSGKEFSINAGVFAINGIDPDAFVTVRYEGYDEYCSFMNMKYSPVDVGELFDGLDLMNNISFSEIYVQQEYLGNHSWNVYDPIPVDSTKADIIKAFLVECRSLKWSDEDEAVHFFDEPDWFEISVAVDTVGVGAQYYKIIAFNKQGTVMTNIMDYGYCFHVGEERVIQLAEALGVTEQTPHISTVATYDLPETTYDASGEYGVETTVVYTTSFGQEALYETTVSGGYNPIETAVTTSVAYTPLPETIPE